MEKFEKTEFGDSVLYHGDCFEILPQLDVTADAVITDSPFGITACEWDDKIDLPRFWELANAKTKPTANFVMFGCGKFSIDLINSNYSGYRYDLIWAKNNRVGFFNANLQPLRAHEQILVFGKNGNMVASTYNPLKTPGGRPRVNRTKRRSGGVYPAGEASTTISDGTTNPISVLAFDHDRGNGQQGLHPCQKPLNLLGWLVMTYTNANDLIIDPYCGSGTTLDAALRLNRRFVGVERDPKYYEIARTRLAESWRRKTARRRLTYLSLPNPTDTAPEAGSAIPPETESQQSNGEATNLQEDLT